MLETGEGLKIWREFGVVSSNRRPYKETGFTSNPAKTLGAGGQKPPWFLGSTGHARLDLERQIILSAHDIQNI